VANDDFCEATVGSGDNAMGQLLKTLFHTDNFRINVVEDAHTVELCGALKNVVACGKYTASNHIHSRKVN